MVQEPDQSAEWSKSLGTVLCREARDVKYPSHGESLINAQLEPSGELDELEDCSSAHGVSQKQ